MKKYFVHLLKKNLLPLACFTLFCVILYVVNLAVEDYSLCNDVTYPGGKDLGVGNLAIAFGMLSIFIPIYIFSYKMNKRSVDMYYSLPICKKKLLAANFLVGLILLYVPYTFSYLLGFVIIAAKVKRLYLIYYLYLYLASIVPGFILYAVTAFVYTRANTVLDGILFVIGALLLLSIAFLTVYHILRRYDWYPGGIEGEAFLPFTPLSQVIDSFRYSMTKGEIGDKWFTFTERELASPENYRLALSADVCTLVGCILWTLLAIGATVGLFMTEKNSKAENCGQISNSVFGYKVQIPAYTVLLPAFMLGIGGEIFGLCAVAFGVFVLSVIYKRSIKIGWKFAVVLIACLVVGILLYEIPTAIYDNYFDTSILNPVPAV